MDKPGKSSQKNHQDQTIPKDSSRLYVVVDKKTETIQKSPRHKLCWLRRENAKEALKVIALARYSLRSFLPETVAATPRIDEVLDSLEVREADLIVRPPTQEIDDD